MRGALSSPRRDAREGARRQTCMFMMSVYADNQAGCATCTVVWK